MTFLTAIALILITLVAVVITVVATIVLLFKRLSRTAGYNFARGRNDFMDDQEQQYRRKQV